MIDANKFKQELLEEFYQANPSVLEEDKILHKMIAGIAATITTSAIKKLQEECPCCNQQSHE